MTQPELIGYVTTEAADIRQDYQVAAWYRTFRCPAQQVSVYLLRTYEGRPDMIHWVVEGVCVDACLVSLFGGVAYGNDPAGKAAIGQPGSVSKAIYAFQLNNLPGLELLPEYEWLRDQANWPREQADRFVKARGGRLTPYDATIINLDWVREHATPGLITEDLAN